MKKLLKTFLTIFGLSFTLSVAAQVPEKPEDISPLLIGEGLPKAILQDAEGRKMQLSDILASKPTVLVFYRGGWCPYCNLQLSGLVHIENDILDLGYQIVAISPDDYKNLQNTQEKNSIKYQIFSDPNGKFIEEIGIAFKSDKMSSLLPVPTVMVLDKKGVIQFEYINPNYKKRLSGELLLAVLKTLNK